MTNRLTKKVENEERYIANSIKREHGERLLTSIARYDKKVYNKLGKLEDLEEQIGCPLDVVVKAFQKYIGWTTDCDFGYDNIPDEFEKYQKDKKFMNLKYNEGLMYIAIQETLEDIELEKNKSE